MADADASNSEGSDITVENSDLESDFGDNTTIDPLNRVQADDEPVAGPSGVNVGGAVGVEQWVTNLFGDSSDDSGDELEGFHVDWVTNSSDFRPANVPQCTVDGGSSFQHPEETTAAYYFGLFWDDEMWERLSTETNRYADQQRTAHPPAPTATRWREATKPSLKAFIGLCFSMGILQLPRRHHYWRTTKWLFTTNFGAIMSRDNFNLIWRYIHLQDNNVPAPANEKLWKLRWFIDHLNTRFQSVYTPYENVTIDESMIKFKGRLGFRQYMPAKPIKWGIKVWALCESNTGYAYHIQVYTGKVGGQQEKGLTHRVCMDLLAPLLGTGVRVYMDNFYTSVNLLSDLRIRGVMACGTVRANRKGLPAALLPKNMKLQRGEFKVAQKDELAFATWMDTKPVLTLSNFHSPEDQGTVLRRRGQTRVPVAVPKMVEDYQRHMRGVDLLDQSISYHTIKHRSKKWWRRLFFYGMMVSAHNAYIVAMDQGHAYHARLWPTFLDFLEDLSSDLIGDTRAGRAPPLPRAPERPLQVHTLERMFDKRRACRECSFSRQPNERVQATNYGCSSCQVPLHQKCLGAHINRANRA